MADKRFSENPEDLSIQDDDIAPGTKDATNSDVKWKWATVATYIFNKIGLATALQDGFMSAAAKAKLDGIEAGAQSYTGAELVALIDAEADANLLTDSGKAAVEDLSGVNTGDEPASTTSTAGVIQQATPTQITNGTANRAITPENLALAAPSMNGFNITNLNGQAVTRGINNRGTDVTYTLANQDHLGVVTFDTASPVTLTVGSNLRSDFFCKVVNRNTGDITIVGDSQALTGTADPDGTVNLVGTGTLFQSELVVGSRIQIGAEVRTVVSIADDTNLVVDTAFSNLPAGAITNLTVVNNVDSHTKIQGQWGKVIVEHLTGGIFQFSGDTKA